MKTSDSYPSVVQGVSQQTPSQRDPGRLAEQVNMLSDPVTGLCRRHGSKWQAERNLGAAMSAPALAAMVADTDNWRTFEYTHGGNDYVVLYRSAERPASSTLPVMYVYNRTAATFLNLNKPVVDATLALLESGGVSAIVAAGRYLLIAGHSIVPTATSTDMWDSADNRVRSVVWIRGGAYSRKYKVTATLDDMTQVDFEYTTPSSSYQGTLDTSDVPVYAADPAGGTQVDTESAYIVTVGAFGEAMLGWASWSPTGMTVVDGGVTLTNVSPADPASATQYRWDAGSSFVRFHPSLVGQLDVSMSYTHLKTITNPNYTKLVADITNEYNTAVTQWIGEAAQAIQPASIAAELHAAAISAGLTTALQQGSTLIFDNVTGLTVEDGGDGSLIRGVANEISSADQVSDVHYAGKVVKVRARSAKEAYYLRATAKDPLATGYTEVIWVEGAGLAHVIDKALVYATVEAGTMHIASSATLLQTLIPAVTVPPFVDSTVGDADTSPLPYFIGRKITYLGMVQDRLLVGAGAVLRTSRVGDYLNFFRSTVLSVLADDPLEVLSQGSDDDTLRHSVLYDRDLVIFGDKRQYVIGARNPITPTSAAMPTMSSHADAANLPPLAVGGVIFYAKRDGKSSSIHQIQPGRNTESPESYPASSQLDTYILGSAIEMAKSSKPAMLFVRTTGARNSLFTFQFLDTEEGRRQDAWSTWRFADELGPVIGLCSTPAGLLVFTIRTAHGLSWLVADLCPLVPGLSQAPYLDSQRPWATVVAGTGSLRESTPGEFYAAFDDSTEYKLLGARIEDGADLLTDYPAASGLVAGAGYDAYGTLTNPFMRDRNDRAITTGQLVVAQVVVSIANSSGFDSTVQSSSSTVDATFNGRVIGDPSNILGRTPITDAQWPIPVGRESRDYELTIKARQWFPLTITLIEWVGQFFNRTRR